MVKRWKDEIKMALVLLACSVSGGYLGATMSQIHSPKPPVICDRHDVFRSLPGSQPTRVIVILVDDKVRSTRHPERAIYSFPRPLNRIQRPVNFI